MSVGQAQSPEDGVPDAVRAAWSSVEARWSDDAAHDELLRLTTIHGCFAWVAGRYRNAGSERRGDPIAARQLERMRKAAEVALLSSGGARGEARTPYRSSILALVVVVVLVVVGAIYAAAMKQTSDARPVPPAPQVR